MEKGNATGHQPELQKFLDIVPRLIGGTFNLDLENEHFQGKIKDVQIIGDKLVIRATMCLQGSKKSPILVHHSKEIPVKLTTSTFIQVHIDGEKIGAALLNDDFHALMLQGPHE
ncbi:MAG: hypothetical protein NVSMB66_3280 [Candidatus Doudnabacteria bacterium]